MSSYMLLSLLSPFINKLISGLDLSMHILLIAILLFFCSVVPTFTTADWAGGEGHVDIFIALYLIGALIKKYDLFRKKNKFMLISAFICVLLMLLSEIIIKKISLFHFTYFVWTMRKTPVIIAAVIIFIYARTLRFNRELNIIKICSGSVFGVYLIHIGKIHTLFFKYIFDISKIYNNVFFGLYLLLYILTIFVFCIIIDKLRIKLIGKKIDRLASYLEEKIIKCYSNTKTLLLAK